MIRGLLLGLLLLLLAIAYWSTSGFTSMTALDGLEQSTQRETPRVPPVSSAPGMFDVGGNDDPRRRFLAGRQGDVEFYGQIVDQDGNPVSDAKVMVQIRSWDGAPGTNGDVPYLTDSNGRFSVTGVSGDVLSIVDIVKSGYVDAHADGASPRNLAFGVKQTYQPDPKQPLVYQVWRTTESHPNHVIQVFGLFPIKPNGGVYTLDLLRSKISPGSESEGDIRVTIDQHIPGGQQPKYRWGYSLEAVDGGLQEAPDDDPFLWRAPQSGYSPVLTEQFEPSDANWTSMRRFRVFIRSRGGSFHMAGTMEIHAVGDSNSRILFQGFLNPDGSPSLEITRDNLHRNYEAYQRALKKDQAQRRTQKRG